MSNEAPTAPSDPTSHGGNESLIPKDPLPALRQEVSRLTATTAEEAEGKASLLSVLEDPKRTSQARSVATGISKAIAEGVTLQEMLSWPGVRSIDAFRDYTEGMKAVLQEKNKPTARQCAKFYLENVMHFDNLTDGEKSANSWMWLYSTLAAPEWEGPIDQERLSRVNMKVE